MKLLHIVGRRNHGKTTLMTELVRELVARGVRVGTIKHSSHKHELDTPGKDSHRHREAGGSPAAIISSELVAAYVPRTDGQDPYESLAPLFDSVDLVLVEGGISGPGKKVEVWRKERGTTPLANERQDIVAVVTDDDIDTPVPTWPRNDLSALADRISSLS